MKRFISLMLTIALCSAILPVSAFATMNNNTTNKQVDIKSDYTDLDALTFEQKESLYYDYSLAAMLYEEPFETGETINAGLAWSCLYLAGLLDPYWKPYCYEMSISEYLSLHEKHFYIYDEEKVIEFLKNAGWYDESTEMTSIAPGGFGGWETDFKLLDAYRDGNTYYLKGIWLGDIYNPERFNEDMEEFYDFFYTEKSDGTRIKGKLVKSVTFSFKRTKQGDKLASYQILPYYDYDGTRYYQNQRTGEFDQKFSVKLEKKSYTYDGKVKSPKVTVTDRYGKIVDDNNYIIIKPKGRKNAGTYKYIIKFRDKYAGSVSVLMKINPRKLTSLTLSSYTYMYNGKTKKPTVTVKAGSLIAAKKRKQDSGSIDIIYPKGRKNVGSYKVKVKGKGNYTGSLTKTFRINPKSTKIKAITKGKTSATVKWEKQSRQTTGYELCYGTSRKKANGQKVLIKKNITTSKKIKNLKKGKKYYIWIRTYKKIDGVYYYSSWSERKTVSL